MSRLCFDLSIKCRFSLLSFSVLSYRGLCYVEKQMVELFANSGYPDET